MSVSKQSNVAPGVLEPFINKLRNGRYVIASHPQPMSIGCDFGVNGDVCFEVLTVGIRHGWRAPFYPQGEFSQKSKYFKSSRGVCVYGHPSEKPVALMQKLVINASKPDFVVLDPFMGSGTTGEACMREGRKFIGIEHNKDYFDMAVKRISAVYAELECEAV